MSDFELKKILDYCPMCDKVCSITLKKSKQKSIVKGCEVECEFYFYQCDECGEEFESGELMDNNLLAMRDAYRVKNKLLTKGEIVEIRKKFDLSQEDLANLLGLGEKTIARYETTTIQDKPYDMLLRKFNSDYNFAYELLLKARDKFSSKKFEKLSNIIRGFISQNSEIEYNEIQLKNNYIFEDKETSANGYALLNVEKIKSMLAYFARYTNNLYTVKLMKLFWYADALSYVRTKKSMSGLIYTHMQMGALPIGYREICALNSVDIESKVIEETISLRFVPKDIDCIDESLFTSEEMGVLQEVCANFKDISGTELSQIMHKEDIYMNTDNKAVLDFSLIKSLKAFE